MTPAEKIRIEEEEILRLRIREIFEKEKAGATPAPSKEVENEEAKRKYKNELFGDILANEKEYNTIITYVSAGALGFFLTINEKLFNLQASHNLWLVWLSVCALLLSLIFLVVVYIVDLMASRKLFDQAKAMPYGVYDKTALTKTADDETEKFKIWFYARFVLLIIGVAAESIFLVLNLNAPSAEKKPENTLKIEGLAPQSKISIEADSTKFNTYINIK